MNGCECMCHDTSFQLSYTSYKFFVLSHLSFWCWFIHCGSFRSACLMLIVTSFSQFINIHVFLYYLIHIYFYQWVSCVMVSFEKYLTGPFFKVPLFLMSSQAFSSSSASQGFENLKILGQESVLEQILGLCHLEYLISMDYIFKPC